MNLNSNQKDISFNHYEAFAKAYAKGSDSNFHNAYYERPAMFSILSTLNFKRV